MLSHIKFVQFNDLERVERLLTANTCAIFMETVQGEGGIYPASPEFIRGVRRLCDQRGILMVSDEIQCGMGRSGAMFAYQTYGVQPDIVVAAKALGCGVPVGAIGTHGRATGVLGTGDHGTTYGSNPLATRAVSTVFQLYRQYGILDHVNQMTLYLDQALADWVRRTPAVREVRGLGLMKGIELREPAGSVIQALQQAGVLVIPSGTHVIRLLPPLILQEEHIDQLMQALDGVM